MEENIRMSLSNNQKIEAVKFWNSNNEFHPLTCGVNGEHILNPKLENENVVLLCPVCGYKQITIPSVVFDYYRRMHDL